MAERPDSSSRRRIPPSIPPRNYPRPQMLQELPVAKYAHSVLKFWAGFLGGFAITGLYVAIIAEAGVGVEVAAKILCAGLVVKALLGIVLACFDRWRFVGVGIFVSM